MLSAGLKEQIIEAAMIEERNEGHGISPWQWDDAEFEAIYALADEHREAAEWDRLMDAAIDDGPDGHLLRLQIAQRMLMM